MEAKFSNRVKEVISLSREEALRRLQEIILGVTILPKARRATKPTYGSQRKRLDSKNARGQTKAMRGKVAL